MPDPRPGRHRGPPIRRRLGIHRPAGRRHLRAAPDQRVRMIEFLWFGESGVQPVLFVERQWLQ